MFMNLYKHSAYKYLISIVVKSAVHWFKVGENGENL